MSTSDEYIIMGKAGSAYGLRGWLKIRSFTAEAHGLLHYDPWYVETEDGWKPFRLEDAQPKGKLLIAKLAGLDSPEAASCMTGKEIAIRRSQLPPAGEDEYYWADLIGMTVIDQEKRVLGKVASLMETGANDVLIVSRDNGSDKKNSVTAIPWLPDTVIVRVDLAERTIDVNWELI